MLENRKNIVSALIFSILTILLINSVNTFIFNDACNFSKFSFSLVFIISFLLLFIVYYKVLSKRRLLPKNKDKWFVLFIKQVINGVALCLFFEVLSNNFYFLGISKYEVFRLIYKSFIWMLLCIALVLINKNINEYLQLISFAEIFILILIFLSDCIWLLFSESRNCFLVNAMFFTNYIIMVLNFVLPMIFYLFKKK